MFTSGKHTQKKSINRGCRFWRRQRNNLTIPTIGISPHVAGQFCPFSNIPDFRTVCLRILTHEPSTSQCVEANNCAAAWFHSIVRLKKLSAWHRFTYTQLYPLCWDRCFMTYSMSQRDGDRCRSLKYPSRCSIASTSFYLQSDLGSDQLPQGNWRDTILDEVLLWYSVQRIGRHPIRSYSRAMPCSQLSAP